MERMIEAKAAVAGILIGLGVIINTLAANPILGAFLFSFGLLVIIELQLPLYTGQIGFIAERKKIDLWKILIFNLLGIVICVGLFFFGDPNFKNILTEKAALKFDKNYIQMLIDGLFCGALIHFAVKCKQKLMTSMAVMIFILIGAEHCIADFPYFILQGTISNFLKFLCVIIGNSLGAIFIENLLKKKGK
jgi:formate/nitrite transporter FocA (FNT family)